MFLAGWGDAMMLPLDRMDVPGLYDEAKSFLRRWHGKRLPSYATLSNAKTAVDNKGLENVAPGSQEATALLKEIETAWLYEYCLGRNSKRMTYACVCVSLLVMFIVGSLYVFYNQGVSLLAEMETLAAKQPDRRFGQLERQLLIARTELFSNERVIPAEACPEGTPDCQPEPNSAQKIDELAQEASYSLLHELRDLNASLTSLQARTNAFQARSVAPVPGTAWLVKGLGAIWGDSPPNNANAASEAGDRTRSAGENPLVPHGKDAGVILSETPLSGVVCLTDDAAEKKDGEAKTVTPPKKKQILGMDMNDVTTQACDYSVEFTSMSIPSVNLWALQVKSIIAPYAAWLLPALFACLGVMVYFLRQMVDPAEPNPPADRVVLRMALAALAGVVAGWFWEPAFGTNSEFKAAGLGLFTFAFVIGFSIEIFFSLLDRFVQISSAAITRLGS